MKKFCNRYTETGERLMQTPVRLSEYPRPELVRESYLCLNGEWDFAMQRAGREICYGERICVPYPPESLLSGIARAPKRGERLYYRRSFTRPDDADGKRVLLHFGAVDQIAEVSLNGKALGRHEGGYDRFTYDITDAIKEENELTVCAYNEKGNRLPWGKQRKRRGGMWYTSISGIWGSVWIECVPTEYVRSLRITTDLFGADIFADGVREGEITLRMGDGEEMTFPLSDGHARVTPKDPRHWSPEDPYLYFFTLKTEADEVSSYFGLRTLEVKPDAAGQPRLCLNGKPYFFHGLLDQGYFSDGLYTPASYECYESDVLLAKSLGFNLLRKHIKVEPSRFYYICDLLGMAVWQDAVNNGDYQFLRDTALPTIGFKRKDDRRLHRDVRTREAFLSGMEKMVGAVSHFPSVVGYTIFNEGWGQFDHAKAYERLKALDPSRFADSVSGWFQPKRDEDLASDMLSLHVYFKPVRLSRSSRPIFLSEFGGYSYRDLEHAFNMHKNYGYSTYKTIEEFEAAFEKLYLDEILPAIGVGLCGTVYTQLSDVEDETNGLVTYDRRLVKLDPTRAKAIAERLFKAFAEATTKGE